MNEPHSSSALPSSSSSSNDMGAVENNKAALKPSTVGYVIAILTIGAAFGNMFLAGRMRNLMNAEMPNFKKAASEYGRGTRSRGFNESNQSNGESSAEHFNAWKRRFEHEQEQQRQTLFHDQSILSSLNTLGIDPAHRHDAAIIKARFRELVLKHHPDMATNQLDKEIHNTKFQEIHSAYQSLLKDIEPKR